MSSPVLDFRTEGVITSLSHVHDIGIVLMGLIDVTPHTINQSLRVTQFIKYHHAIDISVFTMQCHVRWIHLCPDSFLPELISLHVQLLTLSLCLISM